MVVFLLISDVITPPAVSIPKDKGVTSSNNYGTNYGSVTNSRGLKHESDTFLNINLKYI